MSGAQFNRGASRQDYETPSDFIEAVQKRFGTINQDLAASKLNAKGQVWIDEQMDSLSEAQSWRTLRGILWLNPPFANITPWAQKCSVESAHGAKILFLTPASVGTEWFRNHVYHQAVVLFLSPRLKFVGAKDPYPKDCILSCFGYGSGFECWRWK